MRVAGKAPGDKNATDVQAGNGRPPPPRPFFGVAVRPAEELCSRIHRTRSISRPDRLSRRPQRKVRFFFGWVEGVSLTHHCAVTSAGLIPISRSGGWPFSARVHRSAAAVLGSGKLPSAELRVLVQRAYTHV